MNAAKPGARQLPLGNLADGEDDRLGTREELLPTVKKISQKGKKGC
jgi:hypothetical protein